MTELSDQQCLTILTANQRDIQACEQAFQVLVERYDRHLQCTLRRRYPSLKGEDVCDLAQETWLRVWRRIDANIRVEALKSWLFRIGINLAIDWMRRAASHAVTQLGDHDVAASQPEHTHGLAFAEQLKLCVERLRPDDREFLARLFNLESADDIAAALGRAKTRVYQIKHEIGKQLKNCLGMVSYEDSGIRHSR